METLWVAKRIELHQLLKAHPNWSLARLSHALEMSESWVRKWRQRFQDYAAPCVSMFFRRTATPREQARKVSDAVEEAVLSLRDQLSEYYFRVAGAKLIHYHLHKDTTLKEQGHYLPKSPTTIWKILKRAGCIVKPVRLHVPLERPAPMQEWEIDFGVTKSVGSPEGAEFFAAIDRGSSILVYTDVLQRFHADTTLLTVSKMFLLQGLPKSIRFDRDSRLFGAWTRDSYPSPFIRFLRCLNVEPIACPPRRPDKKPFIERVIKTLKHECLFRYLPKEISETASVLDDFVMFYNEIRPNQALSCNNKPPLIAFPNLPKLSSLPDAVNPDVWVHAYHGRVFRRRVNAGGSFMIDRHRYYLGTAYARQQLTVHLDAKQLIFHVHANGEYLRHFEIKGLYHRIMGFQEYLQEMIKEAVSIERYRYFHWKKTNSEGIE